MPTRTDLRSRLIQIEANLLRVEGRITMQIVRIEELRARGRNSRLSEDLLRSLEGMRDAYLDVRRELLHRL